MILLSLFISYSNYDDGAVRSLAHDLERARQTVWLDQDLSGGDTWWRTILEQIRGCTVFVFALSDNSLRSKPCQAELGYAQQLGLPILPVQIGPVDSHRIDQIFTIQSIDYRQPTSTTGIALIAAVQERSTTRAELPNPLPEPPPIPYEYLLKLGTVIDSAEPMSPADQSGVLAQLRQGLRDEEDEGVRKDIGRLMRQMRRRPDVTYVTVNEIDALLGADHGAMPRAQHSTSPYSAAPSQTPAQPGPQDYQPHQPPPYQAAAAEPVAGAATPSAGGAQPAGWYPDTANPQITRYWDGTRWTEHVRDPRQGAGPQSSNQALSIVAIVLGVVSLLFFPIILGPIGIVCGGVAVARKERLGMIGLIVAITGTVVGVILAIAVAQSVTTTF